MRHARSVNLTEDVPLVAGTSYLVSATVEVLVAEVAEGFQDQVRAVRLSSESVGRHPRLCPSTSRSISSR